MNKEQKTIGICLSQVHTYLKAGLVDALSRAASAEGYDVVVFNSSLDYYWSQKGNIVTRCVYDLVRYESLCAMIILHENIYDMRLLEKMIQQSRDNGIPVFYLGGIHNRCVSIVDNYTEAYKSVIRHVITAHGVQTPFFIGGIPGEDNAEKRLQCYREVLEECGVPCREDDIAFGNYLETVALEITRKLLAERKQMPDAFICANDSMAIAVCNELKQHGIRVPEDIIVTGFDGTPVSRLLQPQLTTCGSQPDALARQILSLLYDIRAGNKVPDVCSNDYEAIITESCGCPAIPHPEMDTLYSYQQTEALFNHENMIYYGVERLLKLKDIHEILEMLSALLLPDSALYMNRILLEADPDAEYTQTSLEDELIMVPYRASDAPLVFRKVYRKDMPLPADTADGVSVVNLVHSDTLVCGYYAVHTRDMLRDNQLIKRVSDVLNLVFSILIGRLHQRQLQAHLENNLYMDSLTGLENLKGLTRWFEAYSGDEAHHDRMLALSVYNISRYSYIYETYGMAETEEVSRLTADALREANPEALAIARISEDQYAVVDCAEDDPHLSAVISASVEQFFHRIESYNAESTKPYYLEINCGCTTVERGWQDATLENLIRMALGEMYLNRMKEGRREKIQKNPNPAKLYSAFSLLMEKNLFRYYFQPIIDAKTGLICAYEALMRTDGLIHLSPLEILTTAREYGRLYDVEKITLNGIMERYIHNYSDFQGCPVFINTIPGHFLNDADCAELMDKFGSFLDCFVFELSEDDPTSDEELERLKRLCKPGGHTRIAIDDYGTGHSNIVNLLRYSPHIIKIDRGLISGIAHDSNRQLFVRNTIDFAHQNGIKALAEGVETTEEMRAVISYGIDLSQGYYTGRPSEKPLRALSETVRNEILEEQLRAARYDSEAILYILRNGETANLVDLALRKVTCIQVGSGSFTITGIKSQNVNMTLRIEDNAEAVITLNQINMKGATEPTIQLGQNSRVTLILEGQNTLTKEGILVPGTAELTLAGEGQLHVNNNRNYSVGIGANFNDPYGTIILDTAGPVTIHSSGDKVVCIGGGRSAGKGIRFVRGSYHLSASGINVIGIGSAGGRADISGDHVDLNIHGEGNEVLLIGSVSGDASVRLAGSIQLSSACERVTGIGTLTGTANVQLEGGILSAAINCDAGAILGTFDGEAMVRCRNTRIRLHGEGNRVAGFGSITGACDTRIDSGEIRGELLAGERLLLGNANSRFVVTGGNFQIFQEGPSVPVSPDGRPLFFFNPKEDHFEQTFSDRRETWTYVADRSPEGYLGVFIPDQSN